MGGRGPVLKLQPLAKAAKASSASTTRFIVVSSSYKVIPELLAAIAATMPAIVYSVASAAGG